MYKVTNVNIACSGVYFGCKHGDEENTIKEIISKDKLSYFSKKYKQIPLTVDHDNNREIGYMNNFHMIGSSLFGDINVFERESLDLLVDMYISPEFILNEKTNSVKSMIRVSVVESPAIRDNLKILSSHDIVNNGKGNLPYRAQKVKMVEIADGDACKKCKSLSDKTRNKPITWGQANAMLPVHPNCRCSIK
jgi:hypothetical protein